MSTATKKKRIKKKPRPNVPAPQDQRLVRTSERSEYQECPHRWQWSYLERRKPIHEAPALSFGNLIHQALEVRYPKGVKRGPHPAKTFEKLYEKFTKKSYELGFRDEDGEWLKAGELGVEMMNNYVDQFGTDPEWEVISSEQTFQIPVFDKDGTYVFTYVGTMDGVWRNRSDDGVRVNDYKTCKGDPTVEARNLGYTGALGLQPGAYWTFGVDWLRANGILQPKHERNLDGMVFTYLRKGMKDDRPQNSDGYYLNKDKTVSKRQPPPLIHREVMYRSEQERERYRERAIRQVKEMMAKEAGPPEERMKTPHWMICKMCSLKDACELHELGSEWESFLNGSTTTWDPYSAHEIEESERR